MSPFIYSKSFYMLLSSILCDLLVRMLKYIEKKFKSVFLPTKSCIFMAVGSYFFSEAPTAQNSPVLHFCFMNSFIQFSLLRSLHCRPTITDSEQSRLNCTDEVIVYPSHFGWQEPYNLYLRLMF